jgi:hypothetical protein
MNRKSLVVAAMAAMLPVATASAQFTYNSPTGQPLPTAVTSVGGIVVDFIGVNGNRLVAQRAASGLFVGNPSGSIISIGTQTGFTSTLLGTLGGGIAQAAFRVTLFDGDTRSGNFDFNDNWLLVNGIRVGNFSDVSTITTNGTGVPVSGGGNIANGFGNGILNTGFFHVTDATTLSSIFASLAGGTINYGWEDRDPNDQFLDFTQGVDGTLIDTNVPPVVVPPTNVVPEPSTYALMATGLAGLVGIARRRRNTAA